jgi:O-antigen/teichoic acid export membrane protein
VPGRAELPSGPEGASRWWRGGAGSVLALLAGNLVGAAVGGIFFLVASWRFDLEEMGRYAIAISIQWVVFGLFGTGLAVATLRVARDRLGAGDRAGAAGVVAGALAIGGGVVALLALGCAALPLGAEALLAPRVLALAVAWAGARTLLECIRSGLLAEQRFGRAAILSGVSAATGLAALAFALRAPLDVQGLLAAHLTGMGAGAICGAILLIPLVRAGVALRREALRSLVSYARWPALSEGTRLIQVHMGPLLLAGLAGAEQAGLFGLGRYPAYLFEVVAVSLHQFWLTRAVHQRNPASLRRFLTPQLRLAGALGGAMVLAALALTPALPLLGDNFAAAAYLFAWNALDFALLLLVRPIESVYHGLHRPQLELLQRLAVLPVLLVAALLLVPRLGAAGMVGSHVLAGGAALAFGGFVVWRLLARPQAEAVR